MRTLITLRRAVGALFAVSTCPATGTSCTAGRTCASRIREVDSTGLLQRAPQSPSVDEEAFLSQRVTIEDGAFKKHGREVVLLGGSSVLSRSLVDAKVAEGNAKQLSEDLLASGYAPGPDGEGHPRTAIPCMRLGVRMEAVMPNETTIDKAYITQVGYLLSALERRGVYAFLDVHSNAWSTANGGNGLPSWMGAYMQEGAEEDESFIATAQHPLEVDLPDEVQDAMRSAGVPIPEISSKAQQAGDETGAEPALMFTKQVQSSFRRFLLSHEDKRDRDRLFNPYVNFVMELFELYERHENVVGVELLNEPPPQGLPSLEDAKESRQNIWTFYAKVLEKLEAKLPSLDQRAPVMLQDVSGSLAGANPAFDSLFADRRGEREEDLEPLQSWAADGKLGLSVQLSQGTSSRVGMRELMELAQKKQRKWGDVPVFLSQIPSSSPEKIADQMAQAVEDGVGAVTYWQLEGTTGDVLTKGGGAKTWKPVPSALESLPASK